MRAQPGPEQAQQGILILQKAKELGEKLKQST